MTNYTTQVYTKLTNTNIQTKKARADGEVARGLEAPVIGDSLRRVPSENFSLDVADCDMSKFFTLYGDIESNDTGRHLFPVQWFYGAVRSLNVLQTYAHSIVAGDANFDRTDVFPWKNVSVEEEVKLSGFEETVRFSLTVPAPHSAGDILRMCEAGVKMKEKFHVDRLTSFDGISVETWRDIKNEEMRLEGVSLPSIDYSKFLRLEYIKALKYASRKLRVWIAILFTIIGSGGLMRAFYEDVSLEMIKECPYIEFRDLTNFRRCRKMCEVTLCKTCLLRIRNEDMVKTMIESVDHRRLIRYYYLYENTSNRKRISLRMELENVAHIVSLERWACIMKFLQYAPPRSFDNVVQYFFTTPRNFSELEAFERSFPRNSLGDVHSFQLLKEFIKERTFGEIKRGYHQGAFSSPFGGVLNVRSMVYKMMDFYVFFEVSFHRIKEPEYFRQYGKQDRSMRYIHRLHPREYYLSSEFREFEMDDYEISCQTIASVVEERIRWAEIEYSLALTSFDYRKYKTLKKKQSREQVLSPQSIFMKNGESICYEPHSSRGNGRCNVLRGPEVVPEIYRTSFGVFPDNVMGVMDTTVKAKQEVRGAVDKLVTDVNKLKAIWSIARYAWEEEEEIHDVSLTNVAVATLDEYNQRGEVVEAALFDCVPYVLNRDKAMFAIHEKMCECKRRCYCVPCPYLTKSDVGIWRTSYIKNKHSDYEEVASGKISKCISSVVDVFYKGRHKGYGIREGCYVYFPAHLVARCESEIFEVIYYDNKGVCISDSFKVRRIDAALDVGCGMLNSECFKNFRKNCTATIRWSKTKRREKMTVGDYTLENIFPVIYDGFTYGVCETLLKKKVGKVVDIDENYFCVDATYDPGESGTVLFSGDGVAIGMYLGKIHTIKKEGLLPSEKRQKMGKSLFVKFSAISSFRT